MKKLRVAVNGSGVIGKRVADAVKAQQDMELIGVAIDTANRRGVGKRERLSCREEESISFSKQNSMRSKP